MAIGFNYGGKKKKKKSFSFYGDNDSSDDDYGYSSYGGYGGYSGGYSKKSYSYTDWNWGTYGYTNATEEDDKDLFIKSHESYFTPTSESIASKLSHTQNTKRNRSLIKEFSRFFYHRMIDEKDYFDEKYKDPATLNEKEVADLASKTKYYEELWDKFIPGITPLEQAISLFDELQRQQEKHHEKGEMMDDDMLEQIRGIEFHEEIYSDPIYNELLDMQKLAKDNKMDILNKISMIENLGSQFKIEKEITEKMAHNSRLISKKIMRDYSQLHQVDLYQRLMPTFKTKLLTKDLIINTPIEKTEHKQKIIILVDYSGSMSDQEKQKWVLAIMIDRLKYVMKEEAEIYFSYFVHDKTELLFHHLYDRETALAFWSKFSTRPNGGNTALGDMINHINEEIHKHKRLCNLKVDLSEEMPEVLAINDGQDSVKTKGFTYKTNAITLVDSENEELKKLCKENDGKYVYISSAGTVKTYDKGTR